MNTFLRRPRNDEEGMALISVMLILMILMILVTVTISAAVHSNDVSGNDKHKENAFAAASAGIDDAVHCLKTLATNLPLSNCNINAGASSQLSDGGTNIGQYQVIVTDQSPGLTSKQVLLQATGWGPSSTSVSATRSLRKISATYNLIPNGGFFDAMFAGGSPPNGLIDFKNSATINGTVYARNYSEEKDGLFLGDIIGVGDVTTKNSSQYHSVWAGGSITLGNNNLVQTFAKACGNNSPGNASLGNNSVVAGSVQYKGSLSLNPGASAGSSIQAPCAAPPTLGLPTFSYSAANYSGWAIDSFTSVASANACLATAGSSLATQIASCGMALGDADGTIGHNTYGTVVYVNAAVCGSTPVQLGSATFSGNFTIITNCPLSVNGQFLRSSLASGNKQAVFISTSNTGTNDLQSGITSADPTIAVLLYTTGQLTTTNNTVLAAGACYGAVVIGVNSMQITASNDLAKNPPPGFTFDPSLSTNWIPSLSLWQEG